MLCWAFSGARSSGLSEFVGFSLRVGLWACPKFMILSEIPSSPDRILVYHISSYTPKNPCFSPLLPTDSLSSSFVASFRRTGTGQQPGARQWGRGLQTWRFTLHPSSFLPLICGVQYPSMQLSGLRSEIQSGILGKGIDMLRKTDLKII